MGNQLMGLAAGATTHKMKYGNRGLNQPCVDLSTKRCHITSQNHGYVIDSASLKGVHLCLYFHPFSLVCLCFKVLIVIRRMGAYVRKC